LLVGSSEDESEEEEEDFGSDSDVGWRGKRKSKRPVRQSARRSARQRRIDRDFIDDETSEDEDAGPHKGKEYDSSTSESDKSWGRRKSRKGPKKTYFSAKPKKVAKRRFSDDSEEEKPKKRRVIVNIAYLMTSKSSPLQQYHVRYF